MNNMGHHDESGSIRTHSLKVPENNMKRKLSNTQFIQTPRGSFSGRYNNDKPNIPPHSNAVNINPNNSGVTHSTHTLIDVVSPNFKTTEPNREDVIINSLRNNYLNTTAAARRFSRTSSHTSSVSKSENCSHLNLDIQQANNNPNFNSNSEYLESFVPSTGFTNTDSGNSQEAVYDEISDSNIKSEGGDITRELYNLVKKNDNNASNSHKPSLVRTKSMDNLILNGDRVRKQSTASGLNVPGGFRREFIVNKLRSGQRFLNNSLDTASSNDESRVETLSTNSHEYGSISGTDNYNVRIPFLTRNFLEFLYIYGHFAGESFEDDFISESDKQGLEAPQEQLEITPLLSERIANRIARGAGLSKPMIQTAKGKTPTAKAFLLLLKSFIGTGILFLPNAFSNGGLAFSICMLIFFGVYSYWCYYILIRSKQITGVSSFGEIGLTLYGNWMRIIILASLVLTQLGFSGAYVIFCAKNLKAFFANVFGIEDLKLIHLMILQLLIFIPLSFVRNVSKLSLPSLMANFFIMGGLLIVLFFCVKHLLLDLHFKPEVGVLFGFNSKSWTIFIGTAIFAFEGIGLIIPIQDSMRHPEHFSTVLALVILTATVLFILIGTIGYMAYGKYIETVVLLNLPQSNVFVNMVQLLYSTAILLSTPLQLFPAIKIIENRIFPRYRKVQNSSQTCRNNSGKLDWRVKWRKNTLRMFIVGFVILIAYFGYDDLDKFVSLIGSFACIPLVYMYPPMLHLKSYSIPQSKKLNKIWLILLDVTLITFGGVGMIYTSYQSIFGT